MSIEKIVDYSQFNTNPWLIEFFKDSNIHDILKTYDRQYNDLETVLYDMLLKLWIDNAEGNQLDILGIHIGLNRNGRNDTDYKYLIKMKIEINTSSGQPEKVISALRFLYDTNDIEFVPQYPAKIGIYVVGQTYTLEESMLLLQILPSGVGLILSEEYLTEAYEFLVTEDDIQLLTETFYT